MPRWLEEIPLCNRKLRACLWPPREGHLLKVFQKVHWGGGGGGGGALSTQMPNSINSSSRWVDTKQSVIACPELWLAIKSKSVKSSYRRGRSTLPCSTYSQLVSFFGKEQKNSFHRTSLKSASHFRFFLKFTPFTFDNFYVINYIHARSFSFESIRTFFCANTCVNIMSVNLLYVFFLIYFRWLDIKITAYRWFPKLAQKKQQHVFLDFTTPSFFSNLKLSNPWRQFKYKILWQRNPKTYIR